MGITQSDLIIREAVRAGIKEIRDNPTLIDDMLAELLEDDLTKDRYGDMTVEACRNWFVNTKINVKFGLQVREADFPCVAIALAPTQEAESTLADIDMEDVSEEDPRDSTKHRQRFGLNANETYSLGCFAHGEPELCLFLYSILMFVLLRGKFQYLDQRGFFVSTFQTGALTPWEVSESGPEQIYTRSITLTGKVRHTWSGPSQGDVGEIYVNIPQATGTPITDITEFLAIQGNDILSGVK